MQAQRWLSEHIAENNLIDRCADYLQLSRRTFNRRFKEAAGITPTHFLQQARMQASQNLLLFTRRSVEEICYEVGYDDIGTFYKLFRRNLGTSPNKFRRQLTAGVR
jgi:transcriptional regulator GlxA family with amidase domain